MYGWIAPAFGDILSSFFYNVLNSSAKAGILKKGWIFTMSNLDIKKIEKVIEDFRTQMNSDIIESQIDMPTKLLIEELSRQTYYVFQAIHDELKKL